MPINVTCPGCFTKFTVADKFAGQKGPCKKCKTIIEIPKLEDQVIIHAAEHEAGAIGVSGRHVLKTYKRQDTKFQPLVFAGVIGIVLVMLLVALVLRGQDKPTWLLALGAVILGPPLSWAGYTFLRDDELEGYAGVNLWLRSLACGLVYALLWGIYMFIGGLWFGQESFVKGLEIWQMLVLAVPIGAVGTMAAYVAFDLEPGSGFFNWAMYFAITVVLRLVIGLAAIPGLGAS